VTRHPTSAWLSQQLRESFPYNSPERYLIFDRATNFGDEVISTIKSFGIEPKRTSFRSPWQNGAAERWVGNCRRELLNNGANFGTLNFASADSRDFQFSGRFQF